VTRESVRGVVTSPVRGGVPQGVGICRSRLLETPTNESIQQHAGPLRHQRVAHRSWDHPER
jgi:hypothetical protein